jgi:hypothetical protein
MAMIRVTHPKQRCIRGGKMFDVQISCPTQAGLDTTSGHGIDSLFTNEGLTDPWALSCLSKFVDTTINHNKVFYPVPARSVVEEFEDWLLPFSFVEGRKYGLLEMKTDATADEVVISSEVLAAEYQKFSEWAKQNAHELRGWLKYHRRSQRIKRTHGIFVPKHITDDFWAMRPDKDLTREIGIQDVDLSYSFDAFIRAIQYHHVLGSAIPYFPHPIRNCAFGFYQAQFHHEATWSWGQYFTRLLDEDKMPLKIGWLLDKISSIKNLTVKNDATWYLLGRLPRKDQIDLLSTIAAESDLPAKLKALTHKRIKITLEVSTALLSLPLPIVSVLLCLSTVAVEFWSGDMPGRVGKLPVLKGHLVWPGLTAK